MFAFETAIINFCASVKDVSKRKVILFNFFLLTVVNSTVIVLIGVFSSGNISEYILKESGLGNVIFYCFLISAFESLLILPMTIARLNEKPVLYTVITVSSLLINLFLQLYFILVLKSGFESVFLAKFIAPAAVFIISIPYVLKNLNFNISKEEISSILKFSFPLMLAMLLSLLLNTVDRFILADYVSKSEVAIYTIGYSLGSVTNAFVLNPFVLALNVIFWKKIEDDNFRRFMTKTSTYLFSSMIFISLLITLFIPYFIKIFVRNSELWGAVNIVPFILLSNCFVALFFFPSLDFYHRRRTNVILYIMIICLAFNVIANMIFIKHYGIYASAVVTVFSYLLMFLLGWYITKNYTFTKFEAYKKILLAILFMVFAVLSFAVELESTILEITIKSLMIFLFIFILIILRFFEPIEIERIKGFFNKYFYKKLTRRS